MSPKTRTAQEWLLDSVELQDAYTDFILSRQAKRRAGKTMEFYRYTAGVFVRWLERQGVTKPDEVSARHVRQYLAELAGRNLADRTLHGHARGIRALLRFWNQEGYTPGAIKVDMPTIRKKRLPVLTADGVGRVLEVCDKRERALILLMVDTGLRPSRDGYRVRRKYLFHVQLFCRASRWFPRLTS
jgi:site-specific recombinase XerD